MTFHQFNQHSASADRMNECDQMTACARARFVINQTDAA
jgi:hypothetical protein